MAASNKKSRIYIESSCFIEAAKHAINSPNQQWAQEMWHLHAMFKAARDGKVDLLTATLTIAECQHADEPTSTGIPSDEVKKLFRNFLMSGQYVLLVQDTPLVAERARDLRWAHGICLGGADSLHVASALDTRCDEFLTFDGGIIKKKEKLEAIAISVRLPSNTQHLPGEYRQQAFVIGAQ